jgi:hypothetical protein
LEIALPYFRRLIGQPIHQIDADVVETHLLAIFYCSYGILRCVPSAEKFQFVVVETLDADADAVEGQPTEHADICGRKIVGVGFQRNLNEVVHRKFGIQGVKNLFNMFLLQARRRSSTEINRPNGFVCKHLFPQAYFPAYRFGKFVDRGFVCLRIKIAVDAPRFAERNMKINPCQYYFFSLMISRTKSGSSVVM